MFWKTQNFQTAAALRIGLLPINLMESTLSKYYRKKPTCWKCLINMLVENKEQVFKTLVDNGDTLENFGVKRFGLFGSFVKGTQLPDSDIDLLVEFLPGRKSFDCFMNLSYFLEEILGRKVDLLTRESLSSHIGPKILDEVEYGVID